MSNDDIEHLTYEQKIDLIRGGNMWCWKTFWIGVVSRLQKIIFSREFVVFVIFTVLFFLFAKKDELGYWIVYGSIGLVFIIAEALRELFGKNTKLNLEGKASLNINKGDLNKAAEQITRGEIR